MRAEGLYYIAKGTRLGRLGHSIIYRGSTRLLSPGGQKQKLEPEMQTPFLYPTRPYQLYHIAGRPLHARV